MRTIRVESGQCLMDIAMQYYGSISSLPSLLEDNEIGFDAVLMPGQALQIRDELPELANPRIVQYYFERSLVVNTRPGLSIPVLATNNNEPITNNDSTLIGV